MQTQDKTPYIKYERSSGDVMRIITIEFSADGNAYVADIFESSDLDALWQFWGERFPHVSHVYVSEGYIEEADCLTVREAAEAAFSGMEV